MNDEDEQLRNLYAGLAMLGYIMRGEQGGKAITDAAIALADLMLDKVKAVKNQNRKGIRHDP